MTNPLKLHSKLAEVQGHLQTVSKTGYNKNQNYSYVTEADLLDAVRPLLSERKVSMTIGSTGNVTMGRVEQPGNNGKVRFIRTALVDMELVLSDGETGERVTVKGHGYGESDDDKALYKALTGGSKYLIYKCFGISTGEEPETDAGISDGVSATRKEPARNGSSAAPAIDW